MSAILSECPTAYTSPRSGVFPTWVVRAHMGSRVQIDNTREVKLAGEIGTYAYEATGVRQSESRISFSMSSTYAIHAHFHLYSISNHT